MVRTFITSTLIVAGLAGAAMVPAAPAMARDGRNGAFAAGAAAGVVGGAILGSQARPSYGQTRVYEEQSCYWRRERVYDENIDAYRMRRVQVCE